MPHLGIKLASLLLLSKVLVTAATAASPDVKPNIVVIVADDKYVCMADIQANTRQIATLSSTSSISTYCNK